MSAQSDIDTIVGLRVVDVLDWVTKEDSIPNTWLDVKDWLNDRTTVFLKDNGPGQLSSLSIRGASASQSAIYWNGLEIDNPMLGQLDMSQLQMISPTHIQLFESGVVLPDIHIGGVINLSTKLRSTKRKLQFATKITDYNVLQTSLDLSYGSDKTILHTGFFFLTGQNNFRYKNYGFQEVRLEHAATNSWSFTQSVAHKFTKDRSLQLDVWLRGQARQIAPRISQPFSRSYQRDNNYRLALSYSQDHSFFKLLRIGLLKDSFFFSDSSIQIFAPSGSTTRSLESQMRILQGQTTWDLATEFKYISAFADNYIQSVRRKQIRITNKIQRAWSNHFLTDLRFVQKWVDGQWIQPSVHLRNQYFISDNTFLSLNLGRAIRIPNLNDLYWNPGGNPSLRPERSWKANLAYKMKNTHFGFRLSIFSYLTTDWILWRPGSGAIWSPINIRQVWSRGLNQQFDLSLIRHKTLSVDISTAYELVLATSQKKILLTDQSVGKQLIYTPKHKANFILTINRRAASFELNTRYTGPVLISPDGSRSLKSYLLVDLQYQRQFDIGSFDLTTAFGAKNMTNVNYQIVSDRAMPLRNYYLTILLNH